MMKRRERPVTFITKQFFVDLGIYPALLTPRIADLKSKLSLSSKAHAEGRNGRPPASSEMPSADEQEIVTFTKSQIKQISLALNTRWQRAVNIVDEIRPAPLPPMSNPEETTSVARVNADIDNAWATKRDELIQIYVERLNKLQNLRYFQRRNNIERETDYPTSAFLSAVVVCAFFILESILNGALLG